ncbi:hypothetical protein HJFPF1_12256 [Paramyrothecium foliicola]|nr:hypothetical protein HJFPF1_12256 [Paramyrothecium foliicola]
MADFAARRQENIKQNKALLQDIRVPNYEKAPPTKSSTGTKNAKRKALAPAAPTRSSKRIAEAVTKPSYNEDDVGSSTTLKRPSRGTAKSSRADKRSLPAPSPSPEPNQKPSKPEIESIVAGWTDWEPEATEPTLEADGTFYFESHPEFRPNKSPEEMIREGSFGGSYWRPLRSKRLGITVQDDWKELPPSWTTGLDVDTFLTNPSYNAEVNKYGVACGQSIEEWEAAGWIAHEYDVRGWFQWYCRFWMGRRCPDDERQVGRWKKCVGETGRWRRILLKKYVALGIRSVFDDDDGDDDGRSGDVSPVVHQTCHHWAYEVRQEALDRFWTEGV